MPSCREKVPPKLRDLLIDLMVFVAAIATPFVVAFLLQAAK